MLIGLAVIVAIGLPYYLSSQKAAALDVETTALQRAATEFTQKSLTGTKVRKQSPEWTKARELLTTSMPSDPDVPGAIRALQELADGDDALPDHVRWIGAQISNAIIARPAALATPAVPAEGEQKTPTSVSPVIKRAPATDVAETSTGGYDVSIVVEGSRSKVLAFVSKIQRGGDPLTRLFSVKSVNLAAQISPTGPTPGAPIVSEDDAVVKADIKLKVTLFGVEVASETDVAATNPIKTAASGPTIPAPAISAPAATVPAIQPATTQAKS